MTFSKKISLALAVVLLGFSLLLLLANTMFIDWFYVFQKKEDLKYSYHEIEEIAKNGDIQSRYNTLYQRALDDGISLVIFDKNGNSVIEGATYNSIDEIGIVLSISRKEKVELNSIENYEKYITIDGNAIDFKEKNENLKNVGIIGKILDADNNTEYYIFAYTQASNVHGNTKIFNTFILYATVLLLAIALIISAILGNQLSKPLKEMEKTTSKIANLDFTSKVQVNSEDDEVGKLAVSINKMSSELERTYNELQEANKKLEEDLKLKEKINIMREEFISDVSHELKTPISIIGGYSEALKLEGLSQEDINSYADIIIDESLRMNKLVKDLLKFTQIESGFARLDREDFQLIDMIDPIIRPNELKINEKQISFTLDVPDILVSGDYDMLQTVFTNYFSNAMHYVDEKRIISIYHEIRDNKIRIFVRNSGNNISEENISRIWDSFYKIDKARTRKYGGSGLGLSIVKSIMEAYNNEYGVINLEDGVAFYFDIDIVEDK